MEHQNNNSQQDSRFLLFDPIIVIQDVCKRWMLILLAALVVGFGAYVYADLSYTPQYTLTTTYVVTARGSTSSVYSSLSSTSSLAAVFEKLLNSSLMRKTIQQETGEASFDGQITASVIPETNLINVVVTADDPRTAFLTSQAINDHYDKLTSLVIDSTALEPLQLPTVPTAPSNRADAAGEMRQAAVIAAVIATALLAVMSTFRKTIRSEAEALKVLSCDCLGELPHENKHKTLLSRIRRRKSAILITNPATSFRFVETIRKLRRRIERLMHHRKVIMVTSLLENEGKSTVSANLALALAQKHAKVLLIDCDLRKPACHIIMESEAVENQLSDVLAGKQSLASAVIRDKKSSLDLLLQVRAIRNSGDLIFSAQMRALLAEARREYDYVVLDLPPMAAVSDAEGMMEFADASLLVVRQNVSPSPAVTKAVNALASGKAKLLGCVVNNVYSSKLFSGSEQGYGYGYNRRYHRYNYQKTK